MELTKEQIKQGLDKAYKQAGHNAYVGGVEAGVKYAQEQFKILNIPDVINWVLLPDAGGDWASYNDAANNNCRLKFDDGSECNYNDMDWNFAKVTHYERK